MLQRGFLMPFTTAHYGIKNYAEVRQNMLALDFYERIFENNLGK